ncbi:MAG: thioredoxin family protein, partial [candidate division NC10 bacterium]|nr:thioredoxin family protein [candidate division NC10 bacterium]
MLSERDRRAIRDRLQEMEGPVKLVNFTQELECPTCRETGQLLRELAGLSEKLSLEVHNFQRDTEQVSRYQIDKVPGTVVEGARRQRRASVVKGARAFSHGSQGGTSMVEG